MSVRPSVCPSITQVCPPKPSFPFQSRHTPPRTFALLLAFCVQSMSRVHGGQNARLTFCAARLGTTTGAHQAKCVVSLVNICFDILAQIYPWFYFFYRIYFSLNKW